MEVTVIECNNLSDILHSLCFANLVHAVALFLSELEKCTYLVISIVLSKVKDFSRLQK